MRRNIVPLGLALSMLVIGAGCSKPPSGVGVSVVESSSPNGSAFPNSGKGDPDLAKNCLEPPAHSSVEPLPNTPSLPGEVFWSQRASDPERGTAAVHTGLKTLQTYVSSHWAGEGWEELSGEAEPGIEFEGRFKKGDLIVGVKARAVFCDRSWSEVSFTQART